MTEIEKAREARRCLDKARKRLTAPTLPSMDASACDVTEAVDWLKQVEVTLRRGMGRDPLSQRILGREIATLRRELLQVNALLVAAAKFYTGWGRLASSGIDEAPANYTERGRPGAVVAIRSSVVMHG